MITNIIDKPRQEGHPDLLGVDKYINALLKFIRNCQMPTTIGIQGEWGSGKTSMLNQIRYQLCESDNLTFEENKQKPFYGIWINTWQYSLMKTREETLISILTGLTEEILSIIKKKHETKTKEVVNQVSGIFGKLVKTAVKATANAAGLDGDELVNIFSGNENKATLLTFKKALTDAINKCLEEDKKQGNNNRGFLFFIDDLDRIDPPVAVEILELLKNIFEVDNCVFILAIDYEVVVKGLVPKFGPLTEKNEREFRSFFDKIIQMPFTMPIGSYDVSNFLIESLKSINYVSGGEDNLENFNDMVRKSVGTNPRSLKRLVNTLSLLKIINDEEAEAGNKKEAYELLINFGLVCIQIAYPKIYEFLVSEPNFIMWNSSTAKKYNLPEISEVDNAQISESGLFDEEWEKILFRFCSKDVFLKSKVYDISELLNKIRTIIEENKKEVETEISRILLMSAVTSVNMSANTNVKTGKKDYAKYDITIGGTKYTNLNKRKAMFLVIKACLDNGVNPEDLFDITEKRRWIWVDKECKTKEEFEKEPIQNIKNYDPIRWFNKDEELLFYGGKTYCYTNQIGGDIYNTIKSIEAKFPNLKLKISYSTS